MFDLTESRLSGYPTTPCSKVKLLRLTDEGVFGSKFVTICLTGNKENEIHMEGYQVTNVIS